MGEKGAHEIADQASSPDDKSALSLIDSIQSEGAKIMLGISDLNEANTIPPPCALLREAGLQPAHVLHAAARTLRSSARHASVARAQAAAEEVGAAAIGAERHRVGAG